MENNTYRFVVRKSWNQSDAGKKSKKNEKITLGNFRLVGNLGVRTATDTTTNVNKKWVSDSSEYIRYKKLLSYHQTYNKTQN